MVGQAKELSIRLSLESAPDDELTIEIRRREFSAHRKLLCRFSFGPPFLLKDWRSGDETLRDANFVGGGFGRWKIGCGR